ncbi:hypothetical protein [Litoreibacter roseus]|uniref:Uncharacterized protein n=1 Tax=Litoreibacter roseus TaxID=2601869 RepID=A0A6N6JJ83_9RHOB|nr:hypothetical protein [Litoreibacter roseus]GFE66194.1 hypothetical protein KIN_32680 [Litoreibacter roseus]
MIKERADIAVVHARPTAGVRMRGVEFASIWLGRTFDGGEKPRRGISKPPAISAAFAFTSKAADMRAV